jgi:hypothetical protein
MEAVLDFPFDKATFDCANRLFNFLAVFTASHWVYDKIKHFSPFKYFIIKFTTNSTKFQGFVI